MSEPFHVRIDNRLLHGQVVQFWIPYLEVERLIIADDDAAANPSLLAVYRMAVPDRLDLAVVPVHRLAAALAGGPSTTTLVLIAEVFDVERARLGGLGVDHLVLGNVHAAAGRRRITDAVHLSAEEERALARAVGRKERIEIQTFPGETTVLSIDDEGEAKWSKL